MELFVAWIACPLLLALLCVGCGLATEHSARVSLPRALVPCAGFAALVVTGQYTAYLDLTAELTVPVLCAVALLGFFVGWHRLQPVGPGAWGLAAVALALASYAAPIVASGEATFAGYIKLDDTATWLAFTDQVMERGRDIDPLAPSSFEATLAVNIGEGYPIGVFVPLGVVASLTGQDPAWLVQPYMAFTGGLLALALFALARTILAGPRRAALVAGLAAQPALLYGYYLWGGIKEVAAAAMVATLAAGVGWAHQRRFDPGSITVLGLVAGGLVGVLSPGGLAWALPPLLAGLALALRELGRRVALKRATVLAVVLALSSLPVVAGGAIPPPTSSPLTDGDARGNLAGPLDPLQLAGIWPSGDFRFDPSDLAVTHLLVGLVALGAAAGLTVAWRRRKLAPVVYVAGALATASALALVGSPWVDGKVLATASPAVLFAALLGALALNGPRMRIAGALAFALLAGGVVWSNALAYLDVNLAPRDQLAELEEIGEMVAEEGPALMTEYQPYGVRHFLRNSDPEGASELRRRRVGLVHGGSLEKGEWADTDRFDPAALATYRTLVLRRSPEQSRPPGAYLRVWSGNYYDVWQRPPGITAASTRVSLGTGRLPDGTPECERLQDLVAGSPRSILWASPALEPVFAQGAPLSAVEGSVTAQLEIRRATTYELWLGGSTRASVEVSVDGEALGEAEPLLNNNGLYVELAEVELASGNHLVELEIEGSGWTPGSDGIAAPIGPLALAPADRYREPVAVPSAEVASLCGRSWDWIELAP